MRTNTEWASELQRCVAHDPSKLPQLIAAIQSDARHAGFEQAMRTAMGLVAKSRDKADTKILEARRA